MRISEDPAPGRRLGRYELLRLIGEGGMAQVWAARMDGSRGFQKLVALKNLIPALARDPQFQRMFLDEANLASKVHHRNVVEIFDLGEADGVLFIVMELIDGQSMQRLIRPSRRPQPLSPLIAARIVADAAHGLHAAHELCDERGAPLGLVHRDVCPQNILIDRDGTVKVVDFGIVKAIERIGDTTQTGEIKGKGEYMSPEQAQSLPVDRRSDIFSLGIVLFEAVTGARPFEAPYDMLAVPPVVMTDPVRPSSLMPSCPRDLEWIILTALARDPAQRFQTAEEMAGALEQFLVRASGAVTSEHVAELLRVRCGDAMEELRQKIAMATSPRSTPWRARPGAVLSAAPQSSMPPPPATSAAVLGADLGKRRRGPIALPWFIAAVAVGITMAAGVFVAANRHADGRGPVRHGALSPTAAAPSVVTLYGPPIALRVKPSDAVVRLEGAVIGVGDQLIARPPAGKSLSVEVRSQGRAPQTVLLTSDSPTEIRLELSP